jgi:hypothetical protein
MPRSRSHHQAFRALRVLALLAAVALPLRAQLPTQLADSTYWRLITEFSEPGGYFRSDNFVSNETAWQMVIPELLGSFAPGGAYVGVGPEQNFTYIANFQPALAFIVDIRRQNLVQHLMYKALAELSADRADFISRLFSRPRPAGLDPQGSTVELLVQFAQVPPDSALFTRTHAAIITHLTRTRGFPLPEADLEALDYVFRTFYQTGPGVTYSSNQQMRGGVGVMRGMPSFLELMVQDDGFGLNRSFLGSEALYATFRAYHQRNAIVPVTGNFAGPSALRRVGEYIRAHDAVVDVFYLSNVEQYLFQQGDEWFRFYKNVGTLPVNGASVFIRSVTNRGMAPTYRAGTLMTQLIASIPETLRLFEAGRVVSYYDVIAMSR